MTMTLSMAWSHRLICTWERKNILHAERGTSVMRSDTMEKIVRAFGNAGVEFLDHQGVRMRPEGLEILDGADGIKVFLDNVYAYAQIAGGVIRQNGIEDDVFFACADAATKEHCERMALLRHAHNNVIVRVLVPNDITGFKCDEYAEYRWFPENAPSAVPFYAFGNTVGIFALGQDAQPRIYQITSPIIASAYIKQFDSSWDVAIAPATANTTI